MKRKILGTAFATLALLGHAQSALIISQYAEDGDIKGVEIWNSGPSTITFDATTNLLEISNYNGGVTSPTFTFSKSSGSITTGQVLVFADGSMNSIWADSGITFEEANFSFNGDDALTLSLGGVVIDMFGLVGNDPGSSWTGGGVDTRDQNIQLKAGITTGDADGWTDPSERFEFVAQDPLDSGTGPDLEGFGVAPVPEPSVALLGGLGILGMLRRRR
ncbi:PEP-CTERM sorting domain-containing protein [Haloferula sp.]|uniref:PEP-CTERM sorting domain-containing protein n=1 Tax=Haloferula sp. TaxID=2497595 RepID=UPI003C792A0B